MKRVRIIVHFCLLIIVLISCNGKIAFADSLSVSEFIAKVIYNNESITFNSLEDAVNFINASSEVEKAKIELYDDCYISNTIAIESNKEIQIIPVGRIEIKRKIKSNKTDDYHKKCMFETKKNSVLTFGDPEGMKNGYSLTINGGAEWKNSIISKNLALSSDEAMIIMRNGTINVFDGVSFINNDCVSEYGSVFYVERGCLNIYDGLISGNRSKCGSAIFSEFGNICLYGGRISNNYSYNCGSVYIQFGSSISVKGKTYIYDNNEYKNLYLENTYIDIKGRLTGKIGVITNKTSLSTLVAYSDNVDYLDTNCIIYDKDLELYDLYVFKDKTIRIGAETKIFTDMPAFGIYDYDGKQKPVSYYVKQYTNENGKIIGLAKSKVEYYKRDANKMGMQLVDAPSTIGDYYVVITYEGDSYHGYAPSSKTEKFSINVINQNKDNFYFNLFLENKDNSQEPLISYIEIMPVNADVLSREIIISNTVIEKAIYSAIDYIGGDSRKINLKIGISSKYSDSDIKICFSHDCLDKILDYNIDFLSIDNGNTELKIANRGIYYLYNKTDKDIVFKIEKENISNYSYDIKKLVYNRPLYNYSIYYRITNRMDKEEIVEINEFDKNAVQIVIQYDAGMSLADSIDLKGSSYRKNNSRENKIYFIFINDTGEYTLAKYDSYNEKTSEFTIKTDKIGTVGISRKTINHNFKDIINHWACYDIELMVELKLFTGFNDIEFKPDNEMTRGMFVTVLGRAASNYFGVDIDISGKAGCSFKDVENDKYYAPYIEWAVNAKIVSGTGNDIFQPDKPISREEMCVILNNFMKAFNYEFTEINKEVKFEDEDLISRWALKSVCNMQQLGIIRGANNKFNPKQKATRAEISVIMSRFLNLF